MVHSFVLLELDEALARVEGDKQLLAELITLFLSQLPAALQSFSESLEANDLETATRWAHTLKSSAANVGASKLQAIAYDFERSLKAEVCRNPFTKEQLDELNAIAEETGQSLASELESLHN